jgi:hypothetical protein
MVILNGISLQISHKQELSFKLYLEDGTLSAQSCLHLKYTFIPDTSVQRKKKVVKMKNFAQKFAGGVVNVGAGVANGAFGMGMRFTGRKKSSIPKIVANERSLSSSMSESSM